MNNFPLPLTLTSSKKYLAEGLNCYVNYKFNQLGCVGAVAKTNYGNDSGEGGVAHDRDNITSLWTQWAEG